MVTKGDDGTGMISMAKNIFHDVRQILQEDMRTSNPLIAIQWCYQWAENISTLTQDISKEKTFKVYSSHFFHSTMNRKIIYSGLNQSLPQSSVV